MGHQLWTSPITGYRRSGTRLMELRSLVGAGITARAILEPLLSCPADASAAEMATVLKRRDFDVSGVQLRRDGPVIGFVHREALTSGVVRDHLRQITAEELVSDATTLPVLLNVLKSRQYAFVLVGPQVRGIVTRADLNKPPVRVYLFGLVSLLEMHLGFWIRDDYKGDSWQTELSDGRLRAAKDLRAKRRRRNQDPGLLDCLQLCDKRDLVLAHEALRERLRLGEKGAGHMLLERAEDLRNSLAHSQRDLDDGSSWEAVFELVEWIEDVVHSSDEEIAQKAVSLINQYEDELWASA